MNFRDGRGDFRDIEAISLTTEISHGDLPMSKFLLTAFAGAFLLLSGAGIAAASPIDNGDGSQTCNASGPSGDSVPGVCANDLKTNEDLCDGGLSTEPGGGVTCAESSTRGSRGIQQLKLKPARPKLQLRN